MYFDMFDSQVTLGLKMLVGSMVMIFTDGSVAYSRWVWWSSPRDNLQITL